MRHMAQTCLGRRGSKPLASPVRMNAFEIFPKTVESGLLNGRGASQKQEVPGFDSRWTATENVLELHPDTKFEWG